MVVCAALADAGVLLQLGREVTTRRASGDVGRAGNVHSMTLPHHKTAQLDTEANTSGRGTDGAHNMAAGGNGARQSNSCNARAAVGGALAGMFFLAFPLGVLASVHAHHMRGVLNMAAMTLAGLTGCSFPSLLLASPMGTFMRSAAAPVDREPLNAPGTSHTSRKLPAPSCPVRPPTITAPP